MTIEAKSIDTPDDKRTFEHGSLHIVNLTGATLARATFEPGWRWSTDVKPLVGTESCQASHVSYVISGRFAVRMDDGHEIELGPGDAAVVSPGHDAWVVGDVPCVVIDFAATGSTLAGRAVRCPCGVEFRIAADDQVDHLVAAIQQHASGSHGHDVTREHVLAELGGWGHPQDGDEAAIKQVIEAYGDRLRASDVPGIVDLYTDTAAVMQPELPSAVGIQEVTAAYQGGLARMALDFTFRFEDVLVAGDLAAVRSSGTGTITQLATGEAMPATFRELFVLHRDGGGWKIARYMFQPMPTT